MALLKEKAHCKITKHILQVDVMQIWRPKPVRHPHKSAEVRSKRSSAQRVAVKSITLFLL